MIFSMVFGVNVWVRITLLECHFEDTLVTHPVPVSHPASSGRVTSESQRKLRTVYSCTCRGELHCPPLVRVAREVISLNGENHYARVIKINNFRGEKLSVSKALIASGGANFFFFSLYFFYPDRPLQ